MAAVPEMLKSGLLVVLKVTSLKMAIKHCICVVCSDWRN